jgi:hypothetical protein
MAEQKFEWHLRALLDAEFARQDRRETGDTCAWQRTVWPATAGEQAAAVPARRRPRGTLDAVFEKHFADVPPDALNEKGEEYGGRRRVKMIKQRLGVTVHLRTVMRRLASARKQTS